MVREIDIPSLPLAFWRVVLGAVVYGAILTARRERLSWAGFRACLPAAVLTGLWLAVFYESLKATTLANATMIGALLPVILLGSAARRFHEPISMWLGAMALAAAGGTALVLFGSSAAPTWSARGDGLSVVALVLWAGSFVMSKEARQHVGTVQFQATVWIVAALVLGPVSAVSGQFVWPSRTGWAWVAVLLAVPGTGHFLMNWSHRHVPLMVTSMISLGAAPLSMVGAAIFLDEPIVAIQVAGAAIVIAVLVAVVRRDAQIRARHTGNLSGGPA